MAPAVPITVLVPVSIKIHDGSVPLNVSTVPGAQSCSTDTCSLEKSFGPQLTIDCA
jgi:hypothetical protein